MMRSITCVIASWLSFATAYSKRGLETRQIISTDAQTGRPDNYTIYSFDQRIDHFPNSSRYSKYTNATFSQKYVVDNTYWSGSASAPVFLYIGGETDVASRFPILEAGIIQILMNATGGLGIILENRYYGQSYPFDNSSVENIQYLTTEQTIADNVYFAQNVDLSKFAGGMNVSAAHHPWILYGGSLAGVQTAISLVEYGDVLWGGIASSAPVHLSLAYPEWYYPVQKLGPSDCITRINNIVDKFDSLVAANNTAAIQQFKSLFGLGTLTDIRDFAMAIADPIGGPLNSVDATWQDLNWVPAYDRTDFFSFCNNVTEINDTSIDNALANYTNGEPWTGLAGWASYTKLVTLPSCPDPSLIDTTTPGCFSTQNESYYADPSNSLARSYLYTTCTEQGAYQTAPYFNSTPSLVSRVLQPDYTQQWCTWAFGDAVPANGPNLTHIAQYGGFDISAPNGRLALIDGSSDAWNDLCYHGRNSTSAGDGLRYGDNQYLINGAGHHWDSYGILDLDAEPDFIRAAHEWEIRKVKEWVQQWEDQH